MNYPCAKTVVNSTYQHPTYTRTLLTVPPPKSTKLTTNRANVACAYLSLFTSSVYLVYLAHHSPMSAKISNTLLPDMIMFGSFLFLSSTRRFEKRAKTIPPKKLLFLVKSVTLPCSLTCHRLPHPPASRTHRPTPLNDVHTMHHTPQRATTVVLHQKHQQLLVGPPPVTIPSSTTSSALRPSRPSHTFIHTVHTHTTSRYKRPPFQNISPQTVCASTTTCFKSSALPRYQQKKKKNLSANIHTVHRLFKMCLTGHLRSLQRRQIASCCAPPTYVLPLAPLLLP